MKKFSFAVLLAFSCLATVVHGQEDAFTRDLGKFFKGRELVPPPPSHHTQGDPIHRWNEIAINATGLDHTPVPPGDPRVFGEQLGPGRSSRAMAIVHIAIFDTINAVDRRYHSYTGVQSYQHPLSLDAAIAQTAHDTLVALYPSQAVAFDARLAEDLRRVHNANEKRMALIWASGWRLPFSPCARAMVLRFLNRMSESTG